MSELPTINRFALIVQPTEAYLQWTKTCPDADPNLTLDEIREEASVYLVPETHGDPAQYLRRYAKRILIEELASWCLAAEYWPKDLSIRTYRKFFDVQFASVVFDMGNEPLIVGDE